jgi:DNA-binding IclR family transcriptional regulator
MARKPIDQESRMRGQDRYWYLMRSFYANSGTFTIDDIWWRTNANRNSVAEYMRRLEKAGYIQRVGHEGKLVVFTIARDSRWTPRVRRDGTEVCPKRQDHMWRTMKMLKVFSVQDLAVSASTDVVQVSEAHAKDYLKHLCNAGYVRKTGTGKYALVGSRVTGPLAPYIQRVKQVFDPNLNKVVWSSHEQ